MRFLKWFTNNRSVRDAVTVNAIDKMFFGVILLLFTLLLNFFFERKKNEISFASEFNKIRVEKIGETWEVLNVWEAEVDEYLKLFKKGMNYDIGGVVLEDWDYKRFSLIRETVYMDDEYYQVVKNRFWIGEEQYDIMGDYALLIAQKIQIHQTIITEPKGLDEKQDSIRIINNLLTQKREQYQHVLNTMLDERSR